MPNPFFIVENDDHGVAFGINRNSRVGQVLLILICLFLFPPETQAEHSSDGEHVREIVVGSEFDYPPYALVTADGQADGFSVDLMKAVCRVMGIEVSFRVGPWNEVRKSLEDGKVDALPLVSYSEEREKVFDFTTPHTVSFAAIFKRSEAPNVGSIDDLRGKSIIAMQSDASHDWLLENDISENLILTKTVQETLQLLAYDKNEYAIAPRLVGLLTINELGLKNIELTGPKIDAYGRGYGFAVKQGDAGLLQQLNQGLAIIKETGDYDELYEKWFGIVDPKGIPEEVLYRYVSWAVIGFIILIGLPLGWSISLRNQVSQRTEKLNDEITERKLAENKVRENEARFRAIADFTYDLELWFDPEGKVKWINSAVERMTGYPVSECMAMQNFPLEIVYDEDRGAISECRSNALNKDIENDIDFRIRCKNGKMLWVAASYQPIFDDDDVYLGSRWSIRDISDRKRMEDDLRDAKAGAEEANKAKTEFLASMSHDLRTPLNAVMGFAEMMRLKAFGPLGDPHYETYAKDIQDSGKLLVSLIDDILDISKVEAGKYRLDSKELDLGILVETSVNMISTLTETERVRLFTDIDPNLPRLHGDEKSLTQVLNNLLSNAIKFTPREGQIRVSAKLDGNNSIEIKVVDSGIGMSGEDAEKALQPFEQADSTHSRRHEGTGLGLFLCMKLIKLHDGNLEIDSAVGKGTTVTVLFPPDRTIQPMQT